MVIVTGGVATARNRVYRRTFRRCWLALESRAVGARNMGLQAGNRRVVKSGSSSNQDLSQTKAKAVWHSAKILTNDYRCVAIRQGLPTSSRDTSDAQRLVFPLFQAHLRSMIYLIPLSTLPLLAYGWVLQHRLHPSIPLILQFFIGGSIIVIYNKCGTLLIDLHPSRPSTAQASFNLVRCTFAAGGLAALQPLINAMGTGWCFTIVALATGGTAAACIIIARVWGEHWRRQRQSL